MGNHLKSRTFVITAGGTGGHMFPALAMGYKLLEKGAIVHLITDSRGVKYISNTSNLFIHILPLTGLGKAGKLNRLIGLLTMVPSLFMCLYCLYALKPVRVIGFGGYPSFPCLLASQFLKIPIWLQEQNAYIGRVNRHFATIAEGVAIAFENTKGLVVSIRQKCHVVGIPVRQEVYNVRYADFIPEKEKLKIMVLGGSQGARIFSDVIPAALSLLSAEALKRISIVQQCRSEDQQSVAQFYAKIGINYIVQPFINNIDKELKDTGLLISRSGASTTGEVIASARPALFVPLPIATDDHQYFNAETVVCHGGAWVVREEHFSPDKVAAFIHRCLQERAILQRAHAALLPLARKEATDHLYDLINTHIVHCA